MSDVVPEKFATIQAFAEIVRGKFHSLLNLHRDYNAQFDQLRVDLIESFAKLELMIDQFLPTAGSDEPIPEVEPEAPKPEAAAPVKPAPEDSEPPSGSTDVSKIVEEQKTTVDEALEGRSDTSSADGTKGHSVHDVFTPLKDLYEVAKFAKSLPDQPAFKDLREIVEMSNATHRSLKSCLDNPEKGKEILGDQARALISKLREFDRVCANLNLVFDKYRANEIRIRLWTFIQDVTGNEYEEIRPPERENLLTWLMQKGYTPQGKYYSKVESKNYVVGVRSNLPLDYVVKTITPAYLNTKTRQVPVKAEVVISSGPS